MFNWDILPDFTRIPLFSFISFLSFWTHFWLLNCLFWFGAILILYISDLLCFGMFLVFWCDLLILDWFVDIGGFRFIWVWLFFWSCILWLYYEFSLDFSYFIQNLPFWLKYHFWANSVIFDYFVFLLFCANFYWLYSTFWLLLIFGISVISYFLVFVYSTISVICISVFLLFLLFGFIGLLVLSIVVILRVFTRFLVFYSFCVFLCVFCHFCLFFDILMIYWFLLFYSFYTSNLA